MKPSKKAQEIIKKFKNGKVSDDNVSEILIMRLEESLEAIQSAEEQMRIDANSKKSLADTTKAGYGFIWSRLGDKKKHPGRDIIKDENKKILDNIKALAIRSDDDGDEKPKGGLDKLIVSGGKKAG